MMFRLPVYQDLTREQINIRNLGTQGKHLVVGPPGTGKTVIAIYRSEMLGEDDEEFRLIVYNNTLNQYLETAVNQLGLNNTTCTFHSWFYKWYYKTFREYVPQVDKYKPDYISIFENIGRKGQFEKFPHLIIDEGQDFPAEFYSVMNLLVDNITVFADENQRLTETNSTISQIQKNLGVRKSHPLKKNFRNTKEIAEFACQFYCDLSTGMAEIPERRGPLPILMTNLNFNQQLRQVIRYVKNHPDHQVGVFLNKKDQQRAVYKHLCGELEEEHTVQMYISDDDDFKKIDFELPGAVILNYQSTKGLEFDAVFLPDLQLVNPDLNKDSERMRLFVMCSRAREELFLFSNTNLIPPIMKHVPKHLFRLNIA